MLKTWAKENESLNTTSIEKSLTECNRVAKTKYCERWKEYIQVREKPSIVDRIRTYTPVDRKKRVVRGQVVLGGRTNLKRKKMSKN